MGRGLIILVSGFIIIFGIIQSSLQNRQQILQQRAPEYYYQEQSRNIAGSMLEIALGNVNNENNFLVPETIDNLEIDMMGGTGKVEIESMSNFRSRMHVKITGEIEKYGGDKAITTIDAVFNRKPFSIYAYFTDIEPEIWFGSDDIINGPVHTNGQFHMRGSPTFNGPVTSPNGYEAYPYGDTDPNFNEGANFEASYVELPSDLPDVVALADQGGLKFDEKIEVKFKKNGQVQIREFQQTGTAYECVDWRTHWYYGRYCAEYDRVPQYTKGPPQLFSMDDFNGVISSSEDIEVEGIVNGQVTVHSEKDIEVMGDLVYENRNYDDPDAGPISDDRLGLVSEGDTIVDEDAHRHDNGEDRGQRAEEGNRKNKDVFIDASILTLGKSFRVEGYDDPEQRGNLYILGGLIQRERGPVGTFGGWYGETGYKKRYTYDTRFLENSTPGFPRKKRFEIEDWRESTETIKASEQRQQENQ